MQEVLIEFPFQALKQIGYDPIFEVVEEIQVLDILQFAPETAVSIQKIRFKEGYTVKDLVALDMIFKCELINEIEDTVTAVVGQRSSSPLPEIITSFEILLCFPITFFPSKFQIKFMGSKTALKNLLVQFNAAKIKFNIITITDKTNGNGKKSPRLTQKQEMILDYALNNGYFEIPRAISTQTLADKFSITPAAILEHLRKGQKKIFENLYL